MNFHTRNEWPYPDNDTSPAIMQEWWDRTSAAWREARCAPSQADLLIEWISEESDDYLLDGVTIPEHMP